jgi:hypothetical protein
MTTMTYHFDREMYDRLLARGLPSGLGDTEHACIMACLNLACGGTLTDAAESPCVLPAAARFAVRLNDASWSGEAARADGLRDLGLALLGTNHLDRNVFALRLAEATIREVVPVFLRRAGLNEAADRCRDEGTEESARKARSAAAAAAAYAAAAAAAAAYDAAAYTAYAYAADAAAAYAAAAYTAAAYAAAAAAAAAYDAAAYTAYAYAADAAAYAAAYRRKYGDETLILSAQIATRILTEMKAAT